MRKELMSQLSEEALMKAIIELGRANTSVKLQPTKLILNPEAIQEAADRAGITFNEQCAKIEQLVGSKIEWGVEK